jgi:hypothetical protein
MNVPWPKSYNRHAKSNGVKVQKVEGASAILMQGGV